MKITRGTPEQLKAQVEQRIADLGGSVESATNTANIAAKPDYQPITATSDEQERYLHTLIGDVESDVRNEVDGIEWTWDDENLIAEIAYMSHVFEMKCPLADLSFSDMDADISYVANGVRATLDLGPEGQYETVAQKRVPDSDGFMTEYTLYRCTRTGKYFTMFGDSDYNTLDPDYADAEFDSEDEAMEWFESYEGFEDDDYM